MENYNTREHDHINWTDEQLNNEAATCELLLDKWQVSEERRKQIGKRALLTREEQIHRYAERYQGNSENKDMIFSLK